MAQSDKKYSDIEPDIRPDFLASTDKGAEGTDPSKNLNDRESNPEKTSNDSVREQESQGGSRASQEPWVNKVTGNKKGSGKGFLKKRGPIAAIVLLLGGGGIGIMGLLSPSLLPIHLKEMLTDRFNTQLVGMDKRSAKLLAKKMGTVKGFCNSAVPVKCRYSTMSEKQIKNFDKAGIKVNYDPKEAPTFFGRTKPTSIDFEGHTISAKDFNKTLDKNPRLRSAVYRAYNPKFAGFADSIWSKVLARFKISETKAKIDGDTDEQRLKSIQENTKEGVTADSSGKFTENDINPETGEKYTPDELKAANSAAADAAGGVVNDAADIAKKGIKSTPSLVAGGLLSTLKVSGVMDNACTVYNLIRGVGYAAKAVRALQLARYAMIFLNVADQIKAGEAKTEDVAYIGTILTTEYAATKLSATDSFGYKYAAYGDKGKMSNTAMQFLAGGGLTGDLINLTAIVDDILGGNPKKVCGFLANPFVGAGSAIIGIGSFFVPGAQQFRLAQFAKDAAISAIIMGGVMILPSLLKDIIAGVLVDSTTVGEASGDAIVSGASGMMGRSANMGGNAPLTPEQAVAFTQMQDKVVAKYNAEERQYLSPLNPSSKNTFMGSIVSTLIPYTSKMSSLTGSINSITSIAFGSVAQSLQPSITKAASTDEFTMCQDYDYKELNGGKGVATDPFCNVIYGIPEEALNMDPIEVADKLIEDDQIDPISGDPIVGSEYETFVSDCINRERSLGDTDANGDNGSDGNECFYNDTNKYYYVHYTDQRIENGMDEDFSGAGSNEAGGSADPGDSSQPANTIKANKGWIIKDGVDYSSVPCAEGSKDEGITTHPVTKYTIRKCSTKVGIVASIISKRTVNMVNAAAADGITLTGSGWRSAASQIEKWNACAPNCNGMVARPGNSNHERGLAIDFDGIGKVGSGADYEWLVKNAGKYGYINYWKEGWHWSMSGG